MSADADAQDRLTRLLAAQTEAALSADDDRALGELLARHPELIDTYVAHIAVHNLLAWELTTALEPAPTPIAPATRAWRVASPSSVWAIGVSTAVALLIAVGAAVWLPGKSPVPVAGLLDTEDAVWQAGATPQAGAALPTGRPLRLLSGVARIGMANGAGFVLEGPASVRLEQADRVVLESGRLVALVPQGAEGFRVVTPAAEIIDRGTRFVAAVDSRGATELAVLEGAVEARPARGGQPPLQLEQSQARRFERTGGVVPLVDWQPHELPDPPRLDQLSAWRRGTLPGPIQYTTADRWRFDPQRVHWVESGQHEALEIAGRVRAEPLLANRLSQRLSKPLTGTVWFSFTARYDGLDDDDFFVLWFDTRDTADASHVNAPSVGIKAGRYLARLTKATEQLGPPAVDGQPFRLLGCLSQHDSPHYNRLALWIDPAPGRAAVEQPAAIVAQVGRGSLSHLTHLGIRMGQDTEADDRLLFDALRVGTSPESVLP